MTEGQVSEGTWQNVDSGKFWRELSHPDHIVQIYENDDQLLEQLVGFAASGFGAGESVVIIATGEHIRQLNLRLQMAGHDIFGMRLKDQFITLDASQALYEFVINGTPDAILFRLLAANLMKRAKRSGRKVRAFGEMVAILWAQGNAEGTFCLEHLWSEYMEDEAFALFCAYPKQGFVGENGSMSINDVCDSHSHHLDCSEEENKVRFRKTGTS